MDNLRNEHAYMTGANTGGGFPFPGFNIAPAYGFGGSGIGSGSLVELALISSLFGGKGFGGFGCGSPVAVAGVPQAQAMVDLGTLINQQGQADIRRDVSDSTSEVRESIITSNAATAQGFNSVLAALCGASKESLGAKYEAIIASLHSTNAIQGAINHSSNSLDKKIDCETNALKLQNFNTQVSMDKQFCDLGHRIDAGFNSVREQALVNKVDTMSRENELLIQANQTQSIVRAIADNNKALLEALSCFGLKPNNSCATSMNIPVTLTPTINCPPVVPCVNPLK